MRARCSPASATRTGCSTTRPVWVSRRCGRSATRSVAACASCWPTWTWSSADAHGLLVPVADAPDGDDALGPARVVLDLRPEPLHVDVECLRVAVVVGS